MEVSDALSAFVAGSADAGEFVLVLSGDKKRHREIAIPVAFDAIRSTLSVDHDEVKLHEIAAGVLANLMLFDDANDLCAQTMNIPEFLYECCTKIDDPITICEIFRALSNLVYMKKPEYLNASIPTLCSLVLYLSENSLSPKLLTHVVQLVHYIQIYSPTEMLNDWNQYWNADLFFMALLGLNTDDSEDKTVHCDEEIYSMLRSLQSEIISDCTGLEWLLLTVDRLTLDHDAGTSTCNSEYMLAFVVHLLLSSALQSWESTAHKPLQRSLGVVLSPSTSERFLALSILENIISFRAEKNVDTTVVSEISVVANMYSVGNREGFVTLLYTILEAMEEALLMKDQYGVFAAAYLVVQLFDHEDSVGPFLVTHMPIVFVVLQNVLELLGAEDNLIWVLGVVVQHSTDIGVIIALLNVMHDSLLKSCDSTIVTSKVPKERLLALKEVVNLTLASIL